MLNRKVRLGDHFAIKHPDKRLTKDEPGPTQLDRNLEEGGVFL